MSYYEQTDSFVKFPKIRAALHFCVGYIGRSLGVDRAFDDNVWNSNTFGSFPVTVKAAEYQCGQIDYNVR